MDQETSWMANQSVDTSLAKERYEYFLRPEPRENMSEIFLIDDPWLGPQAKMREVRIGMVRNAKDEDKHVVKCWLEPFPHIRIDSAKPLQGWYQSKNNIDEDGNAHRPRPCFTEAILTEPYGGYCLPPESLVETPSGCRAIGDLVPGDVVIGQIEKRLSQSVVLAKVTRTSFKGVLRLETSNAGRITLTGEHPVYSLDRQDYVRADEVRIGEKIETRSMQELRAARQGFQGQRSSGLLSGLSLPSSKDGGPRSRQTGPRTDRLDMFEAAMSESVRVSHLSFMPELRGGSSDQSWADEAGQAYGDEGYSSITGNESETVSCSDRQETFCGNKETLRGASAIGSHRAQAISQESVHLSVRKDVQPSIILGGVGSPVSGSSRNHLGLRISDHSPQERRLLPARLQIGRRIVHRGQGVHGLQGLVEDQPRSKDGIQRPSVQSAKDEAARTSVVTGIEVLTEPTLVCDIQTSTSNFYVRGDQGRSFHVHNCAVGCQFCYINSGFRGYRGTGMISVPINYGEQVAKQLKKMNRSAAGYFSSFTDPFTPLEDYYHNTERAAEEFVKLGIPIFFLSRLRYPDWAIGLMQKSKYSYAQKSINTCDAEDWRKLSPGALSLEEHLDDIRRLKKAGIYVSIQCNPVVAGITSHEQILRLFKMLKQAGANHVIVKFVEAGYSWAPAMVERMKKVFGHERGVEFEKLFTENIGGQRTIAEKYRIIGHKLYSTAAKRLGLTYATCYEYKYERNSDGTIKGKTGVSIGREYTTADQCHGQRVPMFVRDESTGLFKEVEECPTSGCLYCTDENNGEPRCGDELAGQAKAMKFVDLKVKFNGQ